MREKFTKTMLAVVLISAVQFAVASDYVKNVIVLNEGHYDYTNMVQTVPVTIGAYDPSTHVYAAFDTIQQAQFATCVIVDTNFIFAAADSFLVKYDRFTHQRLDVKIIQGMRKLAVWNNQLLVSRGQYLVDYISYFQVYDKNSLAFQYELDSIVGPQYASEGIVVNNNIAYLAVNNGFHFGNEVGYIGKVDLNAHSFIGNVDLGTNGKNPENIVFDGAKIFTVNNRDYSTGSVSALDVAAGTMVTADLGTASGCGASVLATNYIYYQVSGDTKLTRFSTSTLMNVDTLMINKNIYGMVHDPINSLIYAGETDFLATGKVFIYNLVGVVQDSFNVSVSPGNLALDVRSASGISSVNNELNVAVYPNPAKEMIHITFNGISNQEVVNCVMTDVLGNVVMNRNGSISSLQNISINDLATGVYSISIRSTKGMFTTKIVKE